MQTLVHRGHHDTREHTAYLSNGSENRGPFGNLQRFATYEVNITFYRSPVRTYYQEPRM